MNLKLIKSLNCIGLLQKFSALATLKRSSMGQHFTKRPIKPFRIVFIWQIEGDNPIQECGLQREF
jgi:hypothetical protein